MTQELKLRIMSGAVMAVAVLLLTWAGGVGFNLLAVAIGLLVFHEWQAMAWSRDAGEGLAGGRWSIAVLAGWAVMITVAILLMLEFFALALALGAAAAIVARLLAGRVGMPFWFSGSLIYAAASMVSLAAIRSGGEAGLFAVLFLFAVVWTTDIMAYFVGRAFKGPKLAPSISPGKTWSGAVGGTVFGVVIALLLTWGFGGAPAIAVGGLALVLSVCSQAGDLFESALKRRCGVKDSSHLIPGHGGVMDRVDGLVAAGFALYIIVVLAGLAGQGGSAGEVLMNWGGLAVPTDGA